MMNSIVEYMKSLDNFVFIGSVDENTILSAENKLGLKFADDYRKYVKVFGVASISSHELTGVCSFHRLNVVDVTEAQREFCRNIPDNLYVIEDLHLDSIVIWQSETGEIYETIGTNSPIKIFDSLMDYLEKY